VLTIIDSQIASAGACQFATTHWTIVLSANSDSVKGREALECLCRTYWIPLYSYVRRSGYPPHDAQDLVQAFFLRIIEQSLIEKADPVRGHFRSFLLASLKNFLRDERDKACAQKRGGGQAILSLDEQSDAEISHQREPQNAATIEERFERQWAMAVLDQTLARLEGEYRVLGKGSLFEGLQPALLGESGAVTFAKVGERLGMTEGATKVAAHRMRRRYRELMREEIARTVASPKEIDAEINQLLSAVARV
jgi:RNA polymerase sigma factor (sigma-70 family)